MNEKYTISGDSAEYEFLSEAVELSKDVDGAVIEIGNRRCMGLKYLADVINTTCPLKVLIGVDPYGHLAYAHKEGEVVRLDYTNQMKMEGLAAVWGYLAPTHLINFVHINMTDTDFFEWYEKGIPVYDLERSVVTKYSCIHLDGPHDVASIKAELDWFIPRMDIGATIVFDDVVDFYPHDQIEEYIAGQFEIIKTGGKKQIVRKVSNGNRVRIASPSNLGVKVTN